MPLFLLTAFLVKNETVKGIMGKTQGVISASSPPRKPSKKIVSNPLEADSSRLIPVPPQAFTGVFKSIVGINILFEEDISTPHSILTSIFISSGTK